MYIKDDIKLCIHAYIKMILHHCSILFVKVNDTLTLTFVIVSRHLELDHRVLKITKKF